MRRWLYHMRNGMFVELLYLLHTKERLVKLLSDTRQHNGRWKVVDDQ